MPTNKDNAQKEYNTLLKSGVLLELYEDNLTGNWEEDEATFTKIYDANQFFINDLEVDDYDEI